MIRHQHSKQSLDLMAYHFYLDINSSLGLRSRLRLTPNDYLKPIFRYIKNNLRKIICAPPDILESEIFVLQPLIHQAVQDYLAQNPVIRNRNNKIITRLVEREAKAKGIILKEIKLVMNYDSNADSFTKKEEGKIAYRHADRWNMNTCPYCNANFTFTIRNKRMKSRPQFDHFLNKDRHPYFALSFYNLIPSCALCNSGALKGTKPFSITTHLHPLVEDIEGHYMFRTNVDAVDFIVNKKDFNLTIVPNNNSDPAVRARAKESIKVFGLEDRYSFHKDIAAEVLKKSYTYNNTAIENIFDDFKIGETKIFNDITEVKELIMGNYLHPDRYHKRILSKLTKEIAEEFGITI